MAHTANSCREFEDRTAKNVHAGLMCICTSRFTTLFSEALFYIHLMSQGSKDTSDASQEIEQVFSSREMITYSKNYENGSGEAVMEDSWYVQILRNGVYSWL